MARPNSQSRFPPSAAHLPDGHHPSLLEQSVMWHVARDSSRSTNGATQFILPGLGFAEQPSEPTADESDDDFYHYENNTAPSATVAPSHVQQIPVREGLHTDQAFGQKRRGDDAPVDDGGSIAAEQYGHGLPGLGSLQHSSLPGLASASMASSTAGNQENRSEKHATEEASVSVAPIPQVHPHTARVEDQSVDMRAVDQLLQRRYALAVETLRDLYMCGITFDKLVAHDFIDAKDRNHLQDLFRSAGLPMIEQITTSTPQKSQVNQSTTQLPASNTMEQSTLPKKGIQPLATEAAPNPSTTHSPRVGIKDPLAKTSAKLVPATGGKAASPANAPTAPDRSSYLAKLAAAKKKKLLTSGSATPPLGTGTIESHAGAHKAEVSNAPAVSKAVPNKNALLQEKLALLREQAARRKMKLGTKPPSEDAHGTTGIHAGMQAVVADTVSRLPPRPSILSPLVSAEDAHATSHDIGDAQPIFQNISTFTVQPASHPTSKPIFEEEDSNLEDQPEDDRDTANGTPTNVSEGYGTSNSSANLHTASSHLTASASAFNPSSVGPNLTRTGRERHVVELDLSDDSGSEMDTESADDSPEETIDAEVPIPNPTAKTSQAIPSFLAAQTPYSAMTTASPTPTGSNSSTLDPKALAARARELEAAALKARIRLNTQLKKKAKAGGSDNASITAKNLDGSSNVGVASSQQKMLPCVEPYAEITTDSNADRSRTDPPYASPSKKTNAQPQQLFTPLPSVDDANSLAADMHQVAPSPGADYQSITVPGRKRSSSVGAADSPDAKRSRQDQTMIDNAQREANLRAAIQKQREEYNRRYAEIQAMFSPDAPEQRGAAADNVVVEESSLNIHNGLPPMTDLPHEDASGVNGTRARQPDVELQSGIGSSGYAELIDQGKVVQPHPTTPRLADSDQVMSESGQHSTDDGEVEDDDEYEPAVETPQRTDQTTVEAVAQSRHESLTDESMSVSSGEIVEDEVKDLGPDPSPVNAPLHPVQPTPTVYNHQALKSPVQAGITRQSPGQWNPPKGPKANNWKNTHTDSPRGPRQDKQRTSILGLAADQANGRPQLAHRESGDILQDVKSDLHEYAPYESPLRQFKDFRYHPQYTDSVTGYQSLTYSHNIDPSVPFCRYELGGGVCNDPHCQYQHLGQAVLDGSKLLMQLGGKNPGRTPEEQESFKDGLRTLIASMKTRALQDPEMIAAEIVAFRRDFLQDSSRVLDL